MHRVVTLTTDFGTGSDYVAQVKGRLLHARVPVTLVATGQTFDEVTKERLFLVEAAQ